MKKYINSILLLLSITALALSWTYKNDKKTALTPRFNHVFLSVANIDSSVSFYLKAFDLKLTNRLDTLKIEQADTTYERYLKIAFLKFKGQDFALEISEQPTKPLAENGNQLFNHIGVEVNDINAATKRVENAGGKLVVPIRTIRTKNLGIKQSIFHGPDGEILELVQVLYGGY